MMSGAVGDGSGSIGARHAKSTIVEIRKSPTAPTGVFRRPDIDLAISPGAD
jgi:hypothetical protein